jgi:hypothetical protein
MQERLMQVYFIDEPSGEPETLERSAVTASLSREDIRATPLQPPPEVDVGPR